MSIEQPPTSSENASFNAIEEECPFCKQLACVKDVHEYYRNHSNGRRRSEDYSNKYTVALVSESYYMDTYTGETKYCGYELNYCPTCGKPIK